MDESKLYLCFEATNTEAESVYLIYSTKVSDLMGKPPNFRPEFTYEKSISGFSAMGCGLFDSKIILAGGFSEKENKTEYNLGLVTYDPATKKVAREEFPKMRARKIRPLVFEVNGRLYVLDTSTHIYKRSWELYYPTLKIWGKVSDAFSNRFIAHTGTKNISGRTPYSWFVSGQTITISLPSGEFTYFHHGRQFAKFFARDVAQTLPFHGMATTYFQPGVSHLLVISFTKGMVGGQGRVEGRQLSYAPVSFPKPELIFRTDPYEQPDGEVSSYFADCGNGKFCLTTFDNVNIHVYVFKISRHEHADGSMSLYLKDLDKHEYKFGDFSVGGFTSISLSGCFVLPSDERTKRSKESNLYRDQFLCFELQEKDEDISPFLINTDQGLQIDPEYESDGLEREGAECGQ